MPYKSEAQRRYMHAQHPEIARKWDAEERRAKGKKAAKGAAIWGLPAAAAGGLLAGKKGAALSGTASAVSGAASELLHKAGPGIMDKTTPGGAVSDPFEISKGRAERKAERARYLHHQADNPVSGKETAGAFAALGGAIAGGGFVGDALPNAYYETKQAARRRRDARSMNVAAEQKELRQDAQRSARRARQSTGMRSLFRRDAESLSQAARDLPGQVRRAKRVTSVRPRPATLAQLGVGGALAGGSIAGAHGIERHYQKRTGYVKKSADPFEVSKRFGFGALKAAYKGGGAKAAGTYASGAAKVEGQAGLRRVKQWGQANPGRAAAVAGGTGATLGVAGGYGAGSRRNA